MFKRLMPLLIVILLFGTVFADDNQKADPWSTYEWPAEMLPRFETKQEKASGAVPSLDRITPPPAGEVFLDPEFGLREGVIVRYPFGYGNLLAQMVDNLQDYGIVYILVENAAVESNCYNFLASNGVPWENIECIHAPTNANWSRDYGPWFVWEEDNTLSIIDLIYYADRPQDDFIPEFLETYWGMGYYGPDIHHEGGNMMTDGYGQMMMSTHVFEANPGMTTEQVNQIHHDYMGQDTTYIFERIALDGTGHIDLWSKIMNDTTILVAQMQPDDVNYQLVENHAARMDALPTHTGGTFHIVRCPMPPVAYWWIFPYYRSYINSVLFNGLALIPVYGLEWDDAAIAAYQEALGPDWTVVGLDCNGIAPAGGAIHCTTIAVPEHIESYTHDLELTFEPVSAPIIIPAAGGSFNFDVNIENLENNSVLFDFWVDVTLPGGAVFGPVFKRNSVTLPALTNIGRELSQAIPSQAPEGTYSYNGYVGSYLPLVINSQGSFTFEKTAALDGNYNENDWPVIGWNGETELRNILEVPSKFVLKNNMPNPFNPETSISFELPEAADVILSIYNVNGQSVETLAEGMLSAGNHSFIWNAQNMPSGVYFYSLEANGAVQTKKMVLMK